MSLIEVAKMAGQAAQEKKATRLVLMELKGVSDVCDYQLVCSGLNNIHTKAIARAITDKLRIDTKTKPVRVEGLQTGHWILLDYGGVLVHIFYDYIRDYYAIESLWPNVKILPVQ